MQFFLGQRWLALSGSTLAEWIEGMQDGWQEISRTGDDDVFKGRLRSNRSDNRVKCVEHDNDTRT